MRVTKLIESRHCTYITADGTEYTFFCSAYEYCCGNTCCRPPVFKFYQFWYFWLTVILILLLCSGGSWWYRFRYRNQFLAAGTAHHFATTGGPTGPDFRHPTGVFYYPGTDRVYLTNQPKVDPNIYAYYGGVPAPPAYSAVNPTVGVSYQQGVGQPPIDQQAPPPGFRCMPPSYDSIMQNSEAPLAPYYPQQVAQSVLPSAVGEGENSAASQARLHDKTTDHPDGPPALPSTDRR